MIIKQLSEKTSSAYTYVLFDSITKNAIIIDPVDSEVDCYLKELAGYNLKLILDTHLHADHITGAFLLKQKTKAQYGLSVKLDCIDVLLKDHQTITIGNIEIKIIATPGHTSESVCFLVENNIFTGDTLLVGKCGRTDFQNGDPGKLFDSVTKKLFILPDNMVVYPGHDYEGKTSSTVGQEKKNNLRLVNKTREEFIHIMNNLNLLKPKMMDIAVPANMQCGRK